MRYPNSLPAAETLTWQGSLDAVTCEASGMRRALGTLDAPCYFLSHSGRLGATTVGQPATDRTRGGLPLLGTVDPLSVQRLGSPEFLESHGVQMAYMAGAMAGGIASEALVIALGRRGLLGCFGAGGLAPTRIEAAIRTIAEALPCGPWAFNLLHSPHDPALERRAVELYLRLGVCTVEASAFLDLTANLVHFRAAGLRRDGGNRIAIGNRIVAKVSRREVALKFLEPAPERLLAELVSAGRITAEQAALAARVPMADDITVEADSGGHTDNRPLVCLLPSVLELRDQTQARHGFARPVRIGAAGGIGTPQAACAAFALGADYVVTGSINQSCREAGTSPHTRKLLAQAEMADVAMAPAADMFEMGVRLQVLKRGTLFPMRAQKLYDLYRSYASLEEIPAAERAKLEQQIFRRPLEDVWAETRNFFASRDPQQLVRAEQNPRQKMALVFRWYLGLSSRWSNTGESGRELDYQIWCGPAMGAFNDWVRGSYLEAPDHRSVVDVALQLMTGAAFHCRLHSLRLQGVQVPAAVARYVPEHPLA
jgi:PfaD family protein